MNVSIEIPNDFWIRGDEIEAELQGDLSVKRGREGLMVLGTLRTLRGKFYVYHNAFRITRGEFRFADVKSLKNVYIDLEAESRVYDEKILLTATGFFDNLNISATSESDWSETQIFEALTVGAGRDAEAAGEGGLFSKAFLRAWGYALVNRLGRRIEDELPLDLIDVELGDVGEGDAIGDPRLVLGKYVSRGLYLEYEQSLGSLYGDRQRFTQRGLSYPERQLSIEYRFSDRFTIEGETGTVGGLGYFDVDLKFKFGY
jgi:translocation and assembly module TamB